MQVISCNGDRALTDRVIYHPESHKIYYMSVLSNREETARQITACINLGDKVFMYNTEDVYTEKLSQFSEIELLSEYVGYRVRIERILIGTQKYYFGLILNEGLLKDKSNVFAYKEKTDFDNGLFLKLLSNYTIPLLREWSPALKKLLYDKNSLTPLESYFDENVNQKEVFKAAALNCPDKEFKEIISENIKNGILKITENLQSKLNFSTLNDYIKVFGNATVKNLNNILKPICSVSDKLTVLLKKKKPFPKQQQLIDGVAKRLIKKSYAIINAGMGCGKTLMALAAVEKHSQDKACINVKEDLLLGERTQKGNYRCVILAPSTLLKKWRREIIDEIPLAEASLITSFDDVVQMVKTIKKNPKPKGKEFYIIGRDFSKLSYHERPAPHRIIKRRIYFVKCSECGDYSTSIHDFKTNKTCSVCKNESLEIKFAGYYETGWECPSCGEILYPANMNLKLDIEKYSKDEISSPLSIFSFDNKDNQNICCHNCKDSLWVPNIQNLVSHTQHKNVEDKWVRISVWRNKAKKGKKTIWVYKKYLHLYENYTSVRQSKQRRISPAKFMTSVLPKNSFDYLIADEVHQYKSGGSAQAQAFHALVKLSKKQIALTGTIMGGVAKDMFYLLYRLDPSLMIRKGYKYTDVMKFCEDYGVIETVYSDWSTEDSYNISSRGKKIGEPKVKPGISPMFYSDFLLESTVFMDLSDLASFLPPFVERVERVDMDKDLALAYIGVQKFFSNFIKKGDKRLLSTMLQTLMSYPDKPFGFNSILDPSTGGIMYTFDELDMDKLYNKEQRLVEIVNREWNKENRMCFVFTTFTGENGDKDTLPRLKEVIEDNCDLKGKVAILRSDTVSALNREEWINKQSSLGIRVIICNPRLVEVGFDLLEHPTLIFYQTGYSLFVLWQASRRSYRLNQKKECRVYYLAYKKTLQDKCLEIMADKKAATAAIQGKFSSEGLAAMAQGVDPQVLLAEALLKGAMDVDDKEMNNYFKIINSTNEKKELNMTLEDKKFLEEIKHHKEKTQEYYQKNSLNKTTTNSISKGISLFYEVFGHKNISPKRIVSVDTEEKIQTQFKIVTAQKNKKVIDGQQSFI